MYLFVKKVEIDTLFMGREIVHSIYVKCVEGIIEGAILRDDTHSLISSDKRNGYHTYIISTTGGVYLLCEKFSYIVGKQPYFTDETHPLLRQMFVFLKRNYNLITTITTDSHRVLYTQLGRLYKKYLTGDYMMRFPYRDTYSCNPTKFGTKFVLSTEAQEMFIDIVRDRALTIPNIRQIYGGIIDVKFMLDPSINYISIIMPFARTILSGITKVNMQANAIEGGK